MRLLEIVIILLLFAYHLGFLFKINRPAWLLMPAIILLLASFHLFFEGYRWQMLPAYFLTLILLSTSLRSTIAYLKRPETMTPPFIRFNWLGWVLDLLMLSLSTVLCKFFPVFELPAPGGQYAVGIMEIFFEDKGREELITGTPDDHRSFLTTVWYPAENKKSSVKAPYISADIAWYIAERKAPFSFLLSHFNLIETNSFIGAPISNNQARYPVLIFSHGYESHPSMYHSFVEEIASHGYIIFFINHTYESSGTSLPDGTTIFTDTATVNSSFDWSKIEPHYNRYLEAKTEEEKKIAIFGALKSTGFHDRVKYWAKDVTYLIDQISDNNFHHAFKDKMDLQNLGIIGHSIGGSLAVEMLLKDHRIKVGVNLDGGQYGDVLDSVVNKPFMYVEADREDDGFNNPNRLVYKTIVQHDFYDVKVKGASHSNFYEVALWSGFKGLTGAGSVNPKKCFRITNRSVLLFFDHYLKGSDQNEFHANLHVIPGTEVKIILKK